MENKENFEIISPNFIKQFGKIVTADKTYEHECKINRTGLTWWIGKKVIIRDSVNKAVSIRMRFLKILFKFICYFYCLCSFLTKCQNIARVFFARILPWLVIISVNQNACYRCNYSTDFISILNQNN
jgi:hypothetical protein